MLLGGDFGDVAALSEHTHAAPGSLDSETAAAVKYIGAFAFGQERRTSPRMYIDFCAIVKFLELD